MKSTELDRRFGYHPPTNDETREAHEMIRSDARDYAEQIDNLCPEGREKSLAITKLEEAMMWANAAIARPQQDAFAPQDALRPRDPQPEKPLDDHPGEAAVDEGANAGENTGQEARSGAATF